MLRRGRAGVQGREASDTAVVPCRLQQARIADARGALDDEKRALAVGRASDALSDERKLRLTLEHGVATMPRNRHQTVPSRPPWLHPCCRQVCRCAAAEI